MKLIAQMGVLTGFGSMFTTMTWNAIPLVAVLLPVFMTPARAHVVLDAPNGGEVLEVGSVYTVTWHIMIAHTAQNWDLWYSTTGSGGPWTPIHMDLPPGSGRVDSVHTHDWIIPAEAVSDQVRVRVRMDNTGTDYEDISDGSFTVMETFGQPLFLRGDCNADGKLDVADPIANLTFQFVGTFDPPCHDALDFDDSGELDVTDPILSLTHQFLGGLPPAPPGKEVCGVDPTNDELGCESFAACPGNG